MGAGASVNVLPLHDSRGLPGQGPLVAMIRSRRSCRKAGGTGACAAARADKCGHRTILILRARTPGSSAGRRGAIAARRSVRGARKGLKPKGARQLAGSMAKPRKPGPKEPPSWHHRQSQTDNSHDDTSHPENYCLIPLHLWDIMPIVTDAAKHSSPPHRCL